MGLHVYLGKRKSQTDLLAFIKKQPEKIIKTGYRSNSRNINITPEDVKYYCPW